MFCYPFLVFSPPSLHRTSQHRWIYVQVEKNHVFVCWRILNIPFFQFFQLFGLVHHWHALRLRCWCGRQQRFVLIFFVCGRLFLFFFIFYFLFFFIINWTTLRSGFFILIFLSPFLLLFLLLVLLLVLCRSFNLSTFHLFPSMSAAGSPSTTTRGTA